MDDYKKVEVASYVKEGLENGTMIPRVAEKFARIMARKGEPGETIISWSVDQEGKEIQEKIAQVGEDDFVATKVDENGEIVIDQNNHPNQWIIDGEKFRKKYEVDPNNPELCKPVGGPQTFVEIPDNIILDQWGGDMKIAAGGYINITDPNDMYGISARDFEDTYKFTDSDTKKL